ncbi:hypothetical protein DLAC_08490 [Tieghemostelium lacteum]|uniref:t-SNARE coiled-coil homology domain-containing protein n=1 Tax=Tieghemostelium lacteum TaxID=361077 RepID=A0A151Z7I1_TIELA|nr:hypothetical protein DLAC_08490 [Tieghemostelium lacteum]|eukprot:KYQ89922.1 hypothetical protein DLAC_08490 [Tieghemostelium lacteum]
MGLVENYVEELNDIIVSIDKLFKNDKYRKHEAKELIEEFEGCIFKLSYECRNKDTLKMYQLKLQQYKDKMQKDELLSTSSSSKTSTLHTGPGYGSEHQLYVDKMQNAVNTQKKSIQMLKECHSQLLDTQQMATQTLIKMKEQTEQMKAMDKKLDVIDGHLDQSDKIIKQMNKRWF